MWQRDPESILMIQRDMRARLPDLWIVEVCRPSAVAAMEQLPLWDRAMLFRYGSVAVEPEPHYPLVPHNFARIRAEAIEVAMQHPEILGFSVNSQTPIVQLRNIYYFARSAWDAAYRTTEDAAVLEELARLLHGEGAGPLAAAWRAIAAGDAAATEAARRRLLAEPGLTRSMVDLMIYRATSDFSADPMYVD